MALGDIAKGNLIVMYVAILGAPGGNSLIKVPPYSSLNGVLVAVGLLNSFHSSFPNHSGNSSVY